jgi:hypothetical protein
MKREIFATNPNNIREDIETKILFFGSRIDRNIH